MHTVSVQTPRHGSRLGRLARALGQSLRPLPRLPSKRGVRVEWGAGRVGRSIDRALGTGRGTRQLGRLGHWTGARCSCPSARRCGLGSTEVESRQGNWEREEGAPRRMRLARSAAAPAAAALACVALALLVLVAAAALEIARSATAQPAPASYVATSVSIGSGSGAGSFACAALSLPGSLQPTTLKCWGNNFNGQAGLATPNLQIGDRAVDVGANLPIVALGTGRTAKAIAVGPSFACAVLDTNQAKCWGSGANGRLGLGSTTPRGVYRDEMGDFLPIVALPSGRSISSLVTGADSIHVCVILDDSTLTCWGACTNGQCGLGVSIDWGTSPAHMGDGLPIVNLGAGLTARQVATGNTHSCVRLNDNSVKCFGAGTSGALGLESTSTYGTSASTMGDSLPRVNLGTGRTALSIATGFGHSCAILDNNLVKCWGDASGYQTCLGTTTTYGAAPTCAPACHSSPQRATPWSTLTLAQTWFQWSSPTLRTVCWCCWLQRDHPPHNQSSSAPATTPTANAAWVPPRTMERAHPRRETAFPPRPCEAAHEYPSVLDVQLGPGATSTTRGQLGALARTPTRSLD